MWLPPYDQTSLNNFPSGNVSTQVMVETEATNPPNMQKELKIAVKIL